MCGVDLIRPLNFYFIIRTSKFNFKNAASWIFYSRWKQFERINVKQFSVYQGLKPWQFGSATQLGQSPTSSVQSIHPPDNLCSSRAAESQPQIVAHLWTHNAGSHWKNAKHTSSDSGSAHSPTRSFSLNFASNKSTWMESLAGRAPKYITASLREAKAKFFCMLVKPHRQPEYSHTRSLFGDTFLERARGCMRPVGGT